MIYLFIDKNSIKLLYLKKGLMGQYETKFFEKHHEIDLIENGIVKNTDLLASAIKEGLTLISSSPIKDKNLFLILPQESFHFFRTELPKDIAQSAILGFIKDKVKLKLPIDVNTSYFDYIMFEGEKNKTINFFGLEKETLDKFNTALSLLDLTIKKIFPNTLSYFKLFEKTLRKGKKELILYASCEQGKLYGYLYDSLGLLSSKRWTYEVTKDKTIEKGLKEQSKEIEKEHKHKPNRIILSGSDTEKIRQDTFTKSVGVWTNPLKRIISDFYKEYISELVVDKKKAFPILGFDTCLGAYIFNKENKKFSFFKNKLVSRKISFPKLPINIKYVFLFAISFALSLFVFTIISKSQFNLSFLQKIIKKEKVISNALVTPTTAPSPTVTPTPSIKRGELNIKVLNGGGLKGKAGEVKDFLKENGYKEVLTDNADNFDYVKTEINVKKDKKEASDLLKEDLQKYTDSFKIGEIDDDEAADVIIIIGSDFK